MYVDYLSARLEEPRAFVAEAEARAWPEPAFSYAISGSCRGVERGERINVGVIVFCRPLGTSRFARRSTRRGCARSAPELDLDGVRAHLAAIERIAAGDPAAGPIAQLDLTARFHWLVAPSSTIIQPSEVHAGICGDPARELARLFDELVAGASSPCPPGRTASRSATK